MFGTLHDFMHPKCGTCWRKGDISERDRVREDSIHGAGGAYYWAAQEVALLGVTVLIN